MKGASNFTQGVDNAFYFIMGISFVLLIGLTFTMIYFVIKYNRKRNPKPTQIKDNIAVEITWTSIPLVIVLAMFWYGYEMYSPMREVPDDAFPIEVTGKMWDWDFVYPNGKESDTLKVPLNKAVRLNLRSLDVLHGLYIPAFRIKEDVVPGKDNYMWFIANVKDTFEVSCSAYCGLKHAFMGTKAIVLEEADFNEWMAKVETKTQAQEMPGFQLLKNNGCTGCHSLDGTKSIGPTFKSLYGTKKIVVADGKSEAVTVDEAYIKTAIVDPNIEAEEGYNTGIMRSYQGVLKEEEINEIIEYFKTEAKK